MRRGFDLLKSLGTAADVPEVVWSDLGEVAPLRLRLLIGPEPVPSPFFTIWVGNCTEKYAADGSVEGKLSTATSSCSSVRLKFTQVGLLKAFRVLSLSSVAVFSVSRLHFGLEYVMLSYPIRLLALTFDSATNYRLTARE